MCSWHRMCIMSFKFMQSCFDVFVQNCLQFVHGVAEHKTWRSRQRRFATHTVLVDKMHWTQRPNIIETILAPTESWETTKSWLMLNVFVCCLLALVSCQRMNKLITMLSCDILYPKIYLDYKFIMNLSIDCFADYETFQQNCSKNIERSHYNMILGQT